VGLVRRATWSWWRRTRFSSATSRRDRKPARTLRSTTKMSGSIRQGNIRTAANPALPSWTGFCPPSAPCPRAADRPESLP
jgi:hypothetical protein